MQKRTVFLAWVIVSAAFWALNYNYPSKFMLRGFYTFLALSIIYFASRLVFEEVVIKRIKDPKTKYSFRKTVSILYIAVFLVFLSRIWVESTQTLLVAYGLIGAALAVSLQDIVKNFAGGMVIFITGIYRVGDRVEVNSKFGDVIDIGIFYTTLMEIKEWVAAEQPTGRLTVIPNSYVLSGTVNNYTKDHNFLWDEISIPITYDSDWKGAIKTILGIVKKETEKTTEQAVLEISKLEEKYYIPKKVIEPAIFLTLTDNWINFNIRFTTEVRARRALRSRLSQMVLEEIQKSKDIRIASESFDINISRIPEVSFKGHK